MAVCLGWWVTSSIEKQVIDNTATNLALYVQSFLASELQGLANRDSLTEKEIAVVKNLLSNTPHA